jgi:hypothetical protein
MSFENNFLNEYSGAKVSERMFRCELFAPASSSAKADDPVHRAAEDSLERRRLLDTRRSLSSGGAWRRPVGGYDSFGRCDGGF